VPAGLLVLVAIASVQVGSAVARTLFDELGAAGVTLLRLAIAALVLLALLRPPVRRWSRQQWSAAVLLGLTMASMNLVFYLALRTVPLGIAVTVEFVGPLLLALVQTRRLVDVLWALLAASGVVLLGVDSSSAAPLSGSRWRCSPAASGPATSWPAPASARCCPGWTACPSPSPSAPCWSRRSGRPGRPPSSSTRTCCWAGASWRCCRPRCRTGSSWWPCAGCPPACSACS
jgi:hypothetical protein